MIAKVLIVEDELYLGEDAESDLREIAPEELRAHGITGFQFAHAKWGSRARELLTEAARIGRPFHVMLLDLHLPEDQGDRYLSIEVGFGLLDLARQSRAAKLVITVSAFEEEILRALRGGVADFVPKLSREADLPTRFLRAWKTLIDTENDNLKAARIRQLLPQAQLAWATRFTVCFSEFLREVARTNDDLHAGLSERLDLDFSSDRLDTLVQDAQRLSEVVRQAKRSWESITAEMRPAEKFSETCLEEGLREAMDALEPCFVFRDTKISGRIEGSTQVASYVRDIGTILQELLLGPLIESPSLAKKIHVEANVVRDEPWARLIVHDNGSPMSEEDVDAINNGFPIMPDNRFSRAWGLSIVQHTAIRSGGRVHVSTTNTGNEVTYQIPLARQVMEHADSIRGGERRA